MSRRVAREAAMCLVYAWGMYDNTQLIPIEQSIDESVDIENLDRQDHLYIEEILQGVENHTEKLDDMIEEYAAGWRLERIAKVDLAILRLALYEMYYREDVPVSVAINEAVELAKRYGTEKSSSFINGILGSVARQKEKEEATV